jgi:hypothetical protein
MTTRSLDFTFGTIFAGPLLATLTGEEHRPYPLHVAEKPATDPKVGQEMAPYLGLELPPDFFLRGAFSVERCGGICPALRFPHSFLRS